MCSLEHVCALGNISKGIPCVRVLSRNAVNVVVRVTMPKSTTSVSCEPLGPGQRYEYKQQEKQFVWTLKKMQGGSTCECRAKVCTASSRCGI